MKILALLAFMALSISALGKECIFTRAAFDVGSGTTRMKVAKVDVCKNQIIKVYLKKVFPVKYKASMAQNKSKILGPEIRKKGLQTFSKLKDLAAKFRPRDYVGVATSALRQASNGGAYVAEIFNRLGIKIHIINQKKEAEIGYFGALAQGMAGYRLDDIVVWDIGGGSMQISSMSPSRTLTVYEGHLASIPFKNWLIKNVKHHDPSKVFTPNPLTKKQMMKGVAYTHRLAKEEVPYLLRRKARMKRSLIIGIGAIHNYSVLKQFKKGTKEYNARALEQVISALAGKTDAQIGGEYAATDYSNLGLVLGFMQGLGIKKIQVRNVDMTDGVLINPSI
ncbi:MAG: hypothetical protein E2O68_00395 [Deltaproteobacteria bacterium]|nr:MAG: hypothetical protein E2O68_00395 [Deltaproteobacteria bacterium]